MNNIKKKFQNKVYKRHGFTLLELLIATAISAIVMLSVMITVGNIYFAQKKVRFSQNFYTESRILMERISQHARNNTIDYDRYFIEVGPDDTTGKCPNFDVKQQGATTSLSNERANRAGKDGYIQGYSSIFYWDTNANGNGTQDRNLGGRNIDGDIDPCAQAFHGDSPQLELFLINGARTLRTAIRNKMVDTTGKREIDKSAADFDASESYRIEIQRQLGADKDNDMIVDVWGPYDANEDGDYEDYLDGDTKIVWDDTNGCELYVDTNEKYSILGDETSEDFCEKAYDWTSISPELMEIENLTFQPGPDRDPFLNFRVDEVQVHPHSFISITTNVREPSKFGYKEGEQPRMEFQTMVSSRVFGNTR
jgi:prepilin-type N-terminal cleavage/methylation domain-containing protein